MKRLAAVTLLLLFSLITSNCAPGKPLARSDPFSQTREPGCVPFPPHPTEDPSTQTPTPDIRTQPLPTVIWFTPTPLPIARTIDLSPEIQDSQKSVIMVFRCNGSYDIYQTGPDLLVPTSIPLAYGDTIISYTWPGEFAPPPEPTERPTSTPYPTITPGPSPTDVPINLTDYPAPGTMAPLPAYP